MAPASKSDPPTLVDLGPQGAIALLHSDWLHRKVETLSYTDRLMICRHISIDFTIPPGYEPIELNDATGVGIYYVPILLLRKWPPMMRFDLRAEDGSPLPLLTSSKNREVDAAVLESLAPEGTITTDCGQVIRTIAESDDPEAGSAMRTLSRRLIDEWKDLSPGDRVAWRSFVTVAPSLVSNSILWVRVTARVKQRQIVKISFEHPIETELLFSRRLFSALSWAPVRAHFPIPHLGDAGSYHLQLDPPPGLEVRRARLKLEHPWRLTEGLAQRPSWWRRALARARFVATEPFFALRMRLRAAFASEPAPRSRPPRDPLPFEQRPAAGQAYVWNAKQRLHLHVWGRRRNYGIAEVDMMLGNRGLINGAVVAATLITALLAVYATHATSLTMHVGPSVTVLLLVPGLLGYLVVRPGQHPFVGRHLAGVRLLILATGTLPIVAALFLLSHDSPSASDVLCEWRGLVAAGAVMTALLFLSWLLPAPRGQQGPLDNDDEI